MILSPLLLVIAIAIKIDDPGPVLFRQKRVGIHKTHFSIMKFRTMKMDTPKDTPTHLLENPEQYITKVGKFLRKSSLDELPQIFQIFTGKMSIIGPRPALWNQFDLIAERDKYLSLIHIYVPLGAVDVVVCDGFNGNVLLKTIEGTAMFMGSLMKKMFKKNLLSKLGYLLCASGVKDLMKMLDYREIGGTPFLGIRKPVIKAHGASDMLEMCIRDSPQCAGLH